MRDGGDVTTLFLAARLVRRLLALPGRALIWWINSQRRPGVPPLGTFLRGSMHGLVWLLALMAFSMTLHPQQPKSWPDVPVARPVPVQATRWTPPPNPVPTTTPPVETEDADTAYVPLPDDDDDFDKPRICHRKWWC
jgi:hypothetical protein